MYGIVVKSTHAHMLGRKVARINAGPSTGTIGEIIEVTATHARVRWVIDDRLNKRGQTSHVALSAEGVRWELRT